MTEQEKVEVQGMIDVAIRKAVQAHERNVAIISGVIGMLGLAFYTHGVIKMIQGVGR